MFPLLSSRRLQFPVHMVSDTVKNVLNNNIGNDMVFRTIVCQTCKKMKCTRIIPAFRTARQYFQNKKTEFYPNGNIKRLVLDAKISEHKVFMLEWKCNTNPM